MCEEMGLYEFCEQLGLHWGTLLHYGAGSLSIMEFIGAGYEIWLNGWDGMEFLGSWDGVANCVTYPAQCCIGIGFG